MIRKIRIFLWAIVSEWEYKLYPWKSEQPPSWAISRYNIDHGIVDEYENSIYFGWIKSLEEKMSGIDDRLEHLKNEVDGIKK